MSSISHNLFQIILHIDMDFFIVSKLHFAGV